MSIKNNFPSIRPSLSLHFAKTKKLDPRITFTRASTTTYYDGETVAKAEENLFPRSEEFTNTGWVKSNVTVVQNATAPNGTVTASSVTVSNATNVLQTLGSFVVPCLPSTTYTASVWLRVTSGTASGSFVLSATPSYIGNTVAVSLTTTWQRFTNTFTTYGGAASIFTAFQNFTNGIVYEIWGYQIEQRDSVTAYTPTTGQPITRYQPVLLSAAANTARFQHDPVTGESEGLFIEEQRTNTLTYSEDFSNSAWTQAYLTKNVFSNTHIAPDGTLTASSLYDSNLESKEFGIGQSKSVTTNTVYTLSVYAKAINGSGYIVVRNYGLSTELYHTVVADLSTGQITKTQSGSSASNVSETITDIGNGWYRITASASFNSTNRVGIICVSNSATPSIGGFGQVNYSGTSFNGFAIWGAQLEAGSFPTSYIKTEASQVTRSADSASMTGANFSSWFNAEEGTFYGEAITPSIAGGSLLYALPNSSLTIQNTIYSNLSSISHFVVRVNNVTTVNLDGGTFVNDVYGKVAGSYKANDFAVSLNSGAVSTNTNSVLPSVDRIFIGANSAGTTAGALTIKKISYYPERLTNEQLQALTKD